MNLRHPARFCRAALARQAIKQASNRRIGPGLHTLFQEGQLVEFRWLRSLFLVAALCGARGACGEVADEIRQGEQYLQQGQIEEAIEVFRHAVAADPSSSKAFTRLGGALLLNQRYEESLESFRQAIALDQNGAEAHLGMAIAYIHLGHYGLARLSLDEAERRDPGKKQEIERVVAWLDQRMQGTTSH